MKPKDISLIEQHIEKIVLAVVAIVFIAVVSSQFLGGATRVTVDGNEYPPSTAYNPIEERATRLLAQMNEPRPSDIPASADLGLAEAWENRPAAPAPGETIVALGVPEGPASGEGAEIDEPAFEAGEFRFAELVAPAPATPVASWVRNTLDPVAVASDPILQEIVGPDAQQPYDHTSVTLEFTFDGEELRRALATDPDSDGSEFAALPAAWWRDSMAILEVQIERADGVDASGNPINLVQLPQKPGHEQPIDELRTEDPDAGPPAVEELQAAVDRSRVRIRRQVQPRYYPVLAGPRWVPPAESVMLASIEENRSQIDRLVGQLAERVEELEEAESALGRPNRPGARPPRRGTPAPADTGRQETPEQLRARIDRLAGQVVSLETQLAELNVDAEGNPDLPFFRPPDVLDDAIELLEEPSLRILAHDPTAEPGKSYLYRARVILNNPLYGRGAALPTDQASRAVDPWFASPWSSWSDEIELPPTQLYFLASASEGDQLGGPRATLEMYRFYYGYWRRTSATFEPGEPLATSIRLPDSRLVPIWPEDYVETLAGGGTPAAASPRRVTGRPGMSDPRGRGTRPTRRGGAAGVALLNDPIEPGVEIPLPVGAEPGPQSLPVEVEGLLLDVATLPGAQASGRRFMALLESNGEITSQMTAAAASNPLYQLLQISVRQGQNQGREDFVPPEPEIPEEADEPEEIFVPEPGRGGGGAGGG